MNRISATIFLHELLIQCSVAEYSYSCLLNAADGWSSLIEERDSPAKVLALCTSFLSSAYVIRTLLFKGEGERDTAVKSNRRQALLAMLEIPTEKLATIKNVHVRDSFVHIDERLDKHLENIKQARIEPFNLLPQDPNPNTLVIRRFNPSRLTISCLHREEQGKKIEIELKRLFEEIQLVRNGIDVAEGKWSRFNETVLIDIGLE